MPEKVIANADTPDSSETSSRLTCECSTYPVAFRTWPATAELPPAWVNTPNCVSGILQGAVGSTIDDHMPIKCYMFQNCDPIGMIELLTYLTFGYFRFPVALYALGSPVGQV